MGVQKLALMMLGALLLMPGQSQSQSLQDQITVSVVRSDGILIPFASLKQEGWVKTNARDVFGSAMYRSIPWWFYTSVEGAVDTLTSGALVRFEADALGWGLISSLDPRSVYIQHPMPLWGVATSKRVELLPYERSRDVANEQDIRPVIEQRLNALELEFVEENASHQRTDNGVARVGGIPVQESVRAEARITIDYWVPIEGKSGPAYYFHARKGYRLGSCGHASSLQGWVRSESGSFELLSSTLNRFWIAGCEDKLGKYYSVLGSFSWLGKDYFVIEEGQWESTVVQLYSGDSSKVDLLVEGSP